MESDYDSKMEPVTDSTPPQDAPPKSAFGKKSSKTADPPAPPLKTFNSSKGEGTATTALDPRIPIPEKADEKPPSPSPLQSFTARLQAKFASERKGAPTEEQAAAAFSRLQESAGDFLRWADTSDTFRRTKGPGGLKALVDFYLADRAAPAPAVSDETEYPGTLVDRDFHGGREQGKTTVCIHPETWKMLTPAEQEKWRKYKP